MLAQGSAQLLASSWSLDAVECSYPVHKQDAGHSRMNMTGRSSVDRRVFLVRAYLLKWVKTVRYCAKTVRPLTADRLLKGEGS